MCAAIVSLNLIWTVSADLLFDLVYPNLAATAEGVQLALFSGGASLGPWLIGLIVDYLRSKGIDKGTFCQNLSSASCEEAVRLFSMKIGLTVSMLSLFLAGSSFLLATLFVVKDIKKNRTLGKTTSAPVEQPSKPAPMEKPIDKSAPMEKPIDKPATIVKHATVEKPSYKTAPFVRVPPVKKPDEKPAIIMKRAPVEQPSKPAPMEKPIDKPATVVKHAPFEEPIGKPATIIMKPDFSEKQQLDDSLATWDGVSVANFFDAMKIDMVKPTPMVKPAPMEKHIDEPAPIEKAS